MFFSLGFTNILKFNSVLCRHISSSLVNRMRLVALISGGKDSCYNMLQCVAAGHEIVALAHLKPKENCEELDSFMYQTIGHNAIQLYAEAMEIPLYQRIIEGSNICNDMLYVPTTGDEVEDLYKLLEKIKNEMPIDGVASGAILSNYQRLRVEDVCSRLGLSSYSYLWRRDQEELLSEMISSRMNAIVVKVASLGLVPSQHLGKDISDLFPHFVNINRKYGFNVCGEGGEYETLTLDCPLFNKRIVIGNQEMIIHSNDAFAQVGYLLLKDLHLEAKSGRLTSQAERAKAVGVCTPAHFLLDLNLPNDSFTEINTQLEMPGVSEETVNIDWDSCRILDSAKGWFWISGLHVSESKPPSAAIEYALEQLKELQALRSFKIEDILLVQLFVKNMQDFAEFNNVYKTFFNRNPPSRVCVQATLPQNVSAVLSCIGFKSNENNVVEHMHVQSVSHWAPANIGPYSQSVKLVGNLIFVSGQIALVPGRMQMVHGGATAEGALSLRHVKRVLAATALNCDLSNVIAGVCFVTNKSHLNSVKNEWEKYRTNENVLGTLPEVMNYVVVPALPRGALVEWQVIAIDQHLDHRKWNSFEDTTINNMQVKADVCKWTFESKWQGCITAKCLSDDLIIDDDKLLAVLNYLESLIDSKEVVVNFQVYYPHSSISYTNMLNSQSKFSKSNASFNFIPVDQLLSSSYVILIVGHFV